MSSTIPTVTGQDEIRAAIRARKSNLAVIARNNGMSADLLLTFAEGRCALPADLLRSLTKEVWGGHVAYDDVADVLHPADQSKPVSQGPGPAPFPAQDKPIQRYTGNGPRPHKSAPKYDPKPKRSGWVSRW